MRTPTRFVPPRSAGPAPADVAIRRADPMPFYAQLAAILREQIAQGVFQQGDALPAESELCSVYGLSRTVVRQALTELVAEGLVQKEKGRGTFVTGPKIADFHVQELRGFFEEMSRRGHDVDTVIRSQRVIDIPAAVAAEFHDASGGSVLQLSRTRRANGEPIVTVDTYLPLPRFASLVDLDFHERSLYATLASEFDVSPVGGWRRIEATVASREVADLLGVEIGSPILQLTALSTDAAGVPFEFFRASYRGDRTSLEVRVGGSAR